MPEWRETSIRGAAYHRDLYTSVNGAKEIDEFEHWIATSFEGPGITAIEAVERGERLTREQWQNLAMLFALQDVRTPSTYFEHAERWEREFPALVESTMRHATTRLRHAQFAEREIKRNSGLDHFGHLFDVSINRDEDEGGGAVVEVSMTVDREFWVAAMRRWLTSTAERLLSHKWIIAEPTDFEWPLTDHPAVRLGYSGRTKYDFGGGWGKRNSTLFMPLSPRHLLFTEVGRDLGRRTRLDTSQINLLRRMVLERADRWVFATRPTEWIERARPRVVDAAQFTQEKELWDRWPREQLTARQNSTPSPD